MVLTDIYIFKSHLKTGNLTKVAKTKWCESCTFIAQTKIRNITIVKCTSNETFRSLLTCVRNSGLDVLLPKFVQTLKTVTQARAMHIHCTPCTFYTRAANIDRPSATAQVSCVTHIDVRKHRETATSKCVQILGART